MSKEKMSTKAETNALREADASTSVSAPVVRVRFYPSNTDETFDGTVIDEKPNFYVVIPDENLMLTQNWNKKRCEVLR